VRRRAAGSWGPGPRRRRDAVFTEPACHAKSTLWRLRDGTFPPPEPTATHLRLISRLPHCSLRPLHPSLLMCVRARAAFPTLVHVSPLPLRHRCVSLNFPSPSLIRSFYSHSQGSTPAASPGAGAAKPPPPKQGSPPAAVRRSRRCYQRGISTLRGPGREGFRQFALTRMMGSALDTLHVSSHA